MPEKKIKTNKMPGRKSLPIIIAAISISAIFAAIIFIPCPSDAQYIVFRIVLSLGAGGVAAAIPGFFVFRFKPYVIAGGGLGVFAFVYLFTPGLIDSSDKCRNLDDPFALTVYVHGEKGKNDLVLKGQGQVVIDLEGDRRIRKINETGEAFFSGIPPKFHREPIHINIFREQGTIFEATDTNAVIIGNNKAVYLEVKAAGLDKITGKVRDGNNQPVDGVLVSIQGIEVQTNRMGEFTILINKEKQLAEQKLTAFKKGYKIYDVTVYPATKQEVGIVLKK